MLFWLTVDVAGAVLLFAAGLLGVATWRGWRCAPGSPYWLIAGAGLIYLAIDERLSLHERIGRRLDAEGVPTPPGINHLDDLVLASFALAGLAVTLVSWREVARYRDVLSAMVLAGAFTATALAIDALAPVEGMAPRIEELLELAGQTTFFVAFRRRWQATRVPLGRTAPASVAADSESSSG